MSDNATKHREWFLITWMMDGYDAAISDVKVNDDDIHVIEKKAYDALQKQLDEAKATIERLKNAEK